jgi:eukaryotic-like serine/threonine-protein kinase
MRWIGDRTLAHLRALPDAPPGTDRYELHEELGRGGMGIVYRAVDRELDRDVALKVLNAGTVGIAERLRQEARILGRLEHPGILPIHDIGTLADGRLFYVMKLVRGERLDRYAAREVSLPERLRILDRLCDAVAFAHAHGVIHRDLKPENVMIGAFGEVLVLDWGVAKVREDKQTAPTGAPHSIGTQHGTVLGTPGYMPPEQAAGSAEVDERADVYAIGAILTFLVPEGPRAVKAIAARACDAEPARRYESVGAMAADLKRYAAGFAVAAYREGLFERARRVARRHRTPILLVAAYLLMRIILLLAAGT